MIGDGDSSDLEHSLAFLDAARAPGLTLSEALDGGATSAAWRRARSSRGASA